MKKFKRTLETVDQFNFLINNHREKKNLSPVMSQALTLYACEVA